MQDALKKHLPHGYADKAKKRYQEKYQKSVSLDLIYHVKAGRTENTEVHEILLEIAEEHKRKKDELSQREAALNAD